MIIFGVLAVFISFIFIQAAMDDDVSWIWPIFIMLLGGFTIWWDVASPVYTQVDKEYMVCTEYHSTTYPSEVIICESVHKRNGLNWGSITKDKTDTTYEFIKFYENGDLDKYENISKF